MKHLVLAALLAGFLFSCKKNEKDPDPEPQPVQTGNIVLKIQTYDSLGQLLTDHSGVRIKLDATHSATTEASGIVQFSGMAFGNYFPSLVRDNGEGPPVMVSLSQPNATTTIPFAQRSPYKAQSLTGLAYKKDSIVINFNFDKPVPAGKTVPVALITGTNSSLSANNYLSADIFFTNTNSVNKLNIANFARFKNLVAGLDSNAVFFINVVPVSYGEYESNLVPKPLLLGDNLFAPDNWLLKKEWK